MNISSSITAVDEACGQVASTYRQPERLSRQAPRMPVYKGGGGTNGWAISRLFHLGWVIISIYVGTDLT